MIKIFYVIKSTKFVIKLLIINFSVKINHVNVNIIDDHSTAKKFCTLETKVKVLDYIKEHNISPYKASEYFNFQYSPSSIYKWVKKEDEIRDLAKEKPRNLTVHQGRKSDLGFINVEEQLLEYISLNLKTKTPITLRNLISYWDKLAPEKANDSFNAKKMRVYRFIKKNGFSISTKDKKGQLCQKDSTILIINYLSRLLSHFPKK